MYIISFSRKVLWLAAGTTNNDPRVIARYFVDCVHSLNGKFCFFTLLLLLLLFLGCPKMVRTDYGTENSLLAIIQQILRHNSSDRTSFLYGKSTHNQVFTITTIYIYKLYL